MNRTQHFNPEENPMTVIETAAIVVPCAILILIARNWDRWSEETDGEARRRSEAKKNQ